MSNELWGWLSNSFRCSQDSTSKISACRLKPGGSHQVYPQPVCIHTHNSTREKKKKNLEETEALEESSFFHGWSKKGKEAMSQSLKCHLFSISVSALKYRNHGETSKTHAACRHSSKHIWALAHTQTHPHTPLDICLWLRWWYTTYGAAEPPNPLAERAEESIGSVCERFIRWEFSDLGFLAAADRLTACFRSLISFYWANFCRVRIMTL